MSTDAEKLKQKQKIRKYLVFTGMFLLFLGCMWLIFAPSEKDRQEAERKTGFNAELPDPKGTGIEADKMAAYEQADMIRRQEEKKRTLADFSALTDGHRQDNVPKTEPAQDIASENESRAYNSGGNGRTGAFASSASAYNDINATLGSFYESPEEDPEKEALKAEVEQLRQAAAAQTAGPSYEEQVALLEEPFMDTYLEQGKIPPALLAKGIARRKLIPCYFGAALKLEGVDAFLEGLHRYTLEQPCPAQFGARVFKIAADEKGNRLSYLKITGGRLRVRDSIAYTASNGRDMQEKVSQIRVYAGAKFEAKEAAPAGTVCAVTGLSRTFIGQGLGSAGDGMAPVLEPVLRYGVQLPEGVHPTDALKQLAQLEEEDPALHVVWNDHAGQIQMQLMGEVQLEVLQRLIADRFGMQVQFDAGQITYKETIAEPVEGVGHYEPLCHYAEVHLLLEPLPQGSGLQFGVNCREDDLERNWQRLVLTHLEEKTHLGVLTGSPITDMRITLCAGKAHVKHTEGGDFRQATYRAVRNGLRKAKSILLEPWYEFLLELPTENVGRAMTDLQQMGAEFQPPETEGDRSVLQGSAPVAKLRGYASEVTGYTHGVGRLVCSPKGYAPCQNPEEVIAAVGYDCDSDLENSADSIFCAHGAGFAVKWDEVEQHMHLPGCLHQLEEPDEPAAPVRVSRAAYGGSLAEDKELMAIFERTYGKIDRNPRQALCTPKEEDNAAAYHGKPDPAYDGEEYLLVDGYNIIFAWDELKTIAQNNLDSARGQLMHMLSNYCGYRKCKLILVFDAYKVKGYHGETEQYHNITVVYTKEAETADSYIEKATLDLSKKHKVRVATSDGMEQLIILGNGALRITAAEFRQEVLQTEAAIREYAAQMKQGKKTITEKHSS